MITTAASRRFAPPSALAVAGLLTAVGLAVALAPLPLAVAAAAAALVLPAGLVRPLWLLALVPFAVPFGTLLPLGDAGLVAGGVELALAATLGGWLLRTFTLRHTRIHWPVVLVPLGVWTGLAALSVTTAAAQSVAFKELLKWAEAALALWLAANLAQGARARLLLLAAIALAAGAEAVVGIYQFFTRTGPEGFLIGDRFLRAYGTFGQPNPFAGFLATALPLLLAFLLGRATTRTPVRGLHPHPGPLPSLSPRPAPALGAKASGEGASWRFFLALAAVGGLLLAAVGMSLSRGAWIALIAGIAVVLAVHGRAGRLLLAGGTLAALAVGLLGAFGLLPAVITSRLEVVTQYAQLFDARTVEVTPENFAIVERMAIWQAAWAMFNDAPLLGVGIGNFDARYLDYALRGWNDLPGHAHNYYLTLLAETGVLGLATFLVMDVVLVVALWRVARRARGGEAPADAYAWAVGALGMLTVVAVHNLLDSLFVHGIPVHLGLVLGAAFAPPVGATASGAAAKG